MLLNARHSTTSTSTHTHTHTSIIMLWVESGFFDYLPSHAAKPYSNFLMCCRCRNVVEVCGHILVKMFLYISCSGDAAAEAVSQTRPDQTRPSPTQTKAVHARQPEQHSDILASFTSWLAVIWKGLASARLLAICFEFGINFSHRTQEIEMFP